MSEPAAVGAIAQSCTYFRNLIHRPIDQHIWRSLFLEKFDDPRPTYLLNGMDTNDYPWARVLQDRIRSETTLARRSKFRDLSLKDQARVLRVLTDTIFYSPMTSSLASSRDLQWVDGLVTSREILKGFHSDPHPSQLHAKLHVYWGSTTEEKQPSVSSRIRLASRTFVYDLRNYTSANLWGPFQDSPNAIVSWTHLNHLINVVSMNLEDIMELRDELRPPTGLSAVAPYTAPSVDPSSRDWAGIEGKWYRYRSFRIKHLAPLNTSILEEDDFQEAIRLIELDLRIKDIQPDSSYPTRPKLFFEGTSRSTQQGNETRVQGSVRMTSDGQVRWQYVSVYDGFTQWSSEGIQIGGVASAMGVIGAWTGSRHAEHDPVGPFWLWKVENFV
ncbi:hypothetical protein Clacol_008188 [Clathrus columnatus]|uniref:F-box domain-containing protein n=1 Tax=Clathrus columnatus TaxID=1419009 RepID=A0AAV5ALY1_9AGAM|nr:hypothetical protein Clacol_008188 [Clathrus columnatus]